LRQLGGHVQQNFTGHAKRWTLRRLANPAGFSVRRPFLGAGHRAAWLDADHVMNVPDDLR
jgi:hypothetical protein